MDKLGEQGITSAFFVVKGPRGISKWTPWLHLIFLSSKWFINDPVTGRVYCILGMAVSELLQTIFGHFRFRNGSVPI